MADGGRVAALCAQNILELSEQSEQFGSPSVQNILDCSGPKVKLQTEGGQQAL